MQRCLLQAFQPSNTPPTYASYLGEPDSMGSMALAFRSLALQRVGPVIDAALNTLEAHSDISAAAEITAQCSSWPISAHSNPMKCGVYFGTAGKVPASVNAYCLFGSLSGVLHNTAMEQLQGNRPQGDWGPAIEVLRVMKMALLSNVLRSWDSSEERLMELYGTAIDGNWSSPWRFTDMNEFVGETAAAIAAGGLSTLSGVIAQQETARLLRFPVKQQTKELTTQLAFKRRATLALSQYMILELRGMGQLVDSQFCCWPYSWYWQDIVDLALQQAGGKPGPDAVAAAQQLLKEKHSIFAARAVLRQGDTLAPSYQERVLAGTLISTAPLELDSELKNNIITRGDRKAAAVLAALCKTVPGSEATGEVPSAIHKAGTMFAASPSSAAGSKPLEKQISALLLNEPASSKAALSQVLELVSRTSMQSEGSTSDTNDSIDLALSSALAEWVQVIFGLRCEGEPLKVMANLMWMPMALAQWRILQLASSPENVKLLQVAGAVPEAYLRPIAEYIASRSEVAAALAQQICDSKWNINSASALGILYSQVLDFAPEGKVKVHALLWLAAPAAAAHTEDATAYVSVRTDLGAAIRNYPGFQTQYRACGIESEYYLSLAHELATNEGEEHLSAAYTLLKSVLIACPFSQQPPVLQAMIQATMKRLIRMAGKLGLNLALMDLLQQVPLMLEDDYEQLLCLAFNSGSVSVVAGVWNAAVFAAIDPQLSSLPAFGEQRPNESWLAGELPILLHAAYSSDLQLALVLPAYEATITVLQRQKGQAAAANGLAGQPLLKSVCTAFNHMYGFSSSLHIILQLKVLGLLDMLVQQPHIAKPSGLADLVSACVKAAAAEGDLRVYNTALQQAQQLQLTDAEIQDIRSAALAAAAAAATESPAANSTLQQLWFDAVTAAGADGAGQQAVSPCTAAAVVACMDADDGICSQLLGSSALPAGVLVQLLEQASGSSTIDSILQHADQHQLLHELPATILTAALHSMADDIRCSASGKQAIAVLLQQGQAPGAATAAALLPETDAPAEQWQELLPWLHEQCSTTPAKAAHKFLRDLLQASTAQQQPDQTWQLFDVLEACKGFHKEEAQQGLPAAVCSALIEQQARPAVDADSTDINLATRRVLQLWESFKAHCSVIKQRDAAVSTNSTKLGTEAQRAVISALVTADRSQEALSLVQSDPELLQHIVGCWQQPRKGPVIAELLVQALQAASNLSGSAAARVAEQLLVMLQQEGQGPIHQAVQGESAVRLVQLLSQHDRLAAAQGLLVECVVGKEQPELAAPAVAAFMQAASRDSESQSMAAQLFQQQPQQAHSLLLATLDTLLARHNTSAAATALVLHTLQKHSTTTSGKPPLPDLLSTGQLEQVVKLSCTTNVHGTSRIDSLALLSPFHLAEQCVFAAHNH